MSRMVRGFEREAEFCQFVPSKCVKAATALVREAPPGNPYRDQRVCELHAQEMIDSGFYFRVGASQ